MYFCSKCKRCDCLKAKPPELYLERRTANINALPACLLPNECIAFGAEFKKRHLINMEGCTKAFSRLVFMNS